MIDDVSFVAAFTLSSADVLSALASNSAAVVLNGASMTGTAFLSFASALDLSAAGSIDASLGTITLGAVSGATTFSAALTISSGDLSVSAGNVTQIPTTGDQTYLFSATANESNIALGLDGTDTRIIQFDRTSGDLDIGIGTTRGTIVTNLMKLDSSGNMTIPEGLTTLQRTTASILTLDNTTNQDQTPVATTDAVIDLLFKGKDSVSHNIARIVAMGSGSNWSAATSNQAATDLAFFVQDNSSTDVTNPATQTPGIRLTPDGVDINTDINITGALNHDGATVGFYATTPIAQQTGVAVTAAGIHAAIVALGLFTA